MSVGIIAGNVASMNIVTATVDLGSVAANTTEEEDATLNGVKVGDVVIPIKPTLEAGLAIIQARVDEADSLKLTVANVTASPIDEASETLTFLVVRPEGNGSSLPTAIAT
jgi:hypothetical protein